MAERWTKEEVSTRIDDEGGVPNALLLGGLGSEILSADTPDAVIEAWNRLGGQAKHDVATIQAWLDGAESEADSV